MKMKVQLVAAFGAGLLLTAAAGNLFAQTAVTRATAGRATTRIDPVTVTFVPAAPVVTVTVPETTAAVVGRTPRPPIINTRSPGRPAPIIPIPR